MSIIISDYQIYKNCFLPFGIRSAKAEGKVTVHVLQGFWPVCCLFTRLTVWLCYFSYGHGFIVSSRSFYGRWGRWCEIPSPLCFFSMFIDDLCSCIPFSKFHSYTDDLQIYWSGDRKDLNEMTSTLNEDLAVISRWSAENGL
jgi:hypothetical protein